MKITKFFNIIHTSRVFIIVFPLISSLIANAQIRSTTPVYPYPIEFAQPDGTTLTLLAKGDYVVNWGKTTDGYTIIRNNQGAYEYAIPDEDDNMTPSGILAHNSLLRSQEETTFLETVSKDLFFSKMQIKMLRENSSYIHGKAPTDVFPSTGTCNMLMILVNFNNTTTTYTQTNFNNYMNQAGYSYQSATGSFKDYYLDDSYNLLVISTTVVGWVTAPNAHNYYGPDSKWTELARDAVVAANTANPGWND
ncbi:MAG: hypothetical protein HY738_16460 [Bacteroidia bacterium]|nr:hypothetical protein [Bacteroidia bacterium]